MSQKEASTRRMYGRSILKKHPTRIKEVILEKEVLYLEEKQKGVIIIIR